MDKITKYNCNELCCEKYCGNRYTHHTTIKINEMELHLAFCEEHANKFEDDIIKNGN